MNAITTSKGFTISTERIIRSTDPAGASAIIGNIVDSDDGQARFNPTHRICVSHRPEALRAIADLIDGDDVVDAEIHCTDCNSELYAKIKNHIIERIVHRQTMIDTTHAPITMRPIHRAALYELDELAKFFHEDADS